MKKIFIYLLFSFVMFLPFTSAATKHSAEISKIETSIYGFDYNKDTETKRVERLEKEIYGVTKSGELEKRIKDLSQDISADVIGLEIEPTEDTYLAQEEKADNSVNYPIVNEIEQKLFNKTFKERDFHTRIVTIERKLFGKIYDVDDYSVRMDRIKNKMYPETLAQNTTQEPKTYDSSSFDNTFKNSTKNLFERPFGQRNYTRPYANYGNLSDMNDFNKNPENIEDELTKLENETFGTSFSDDTQTRLKRLNSAQKAKKSSSRYDSAKFQQRMSTAIEIGALILMVLAMVL